jgi:hypothetical protein
MYRIIDGRGTGKTSRLLLLAKENNSVVVCGNPDQMRNHAYRYGLTGIDYISYADYISYLGGYRPENLVDRTFLIDEMELFLKAMCQKVIGYTLSLDD